MSTVDPTEASVRQLLRQIAETEVPTNVERDEIAASMWASFHAEPIGRAPTVVPKLAQPAPAKRSRGLGFRIALVAASILTVAAFALARPSERVTTADNVVDNPTFVDGPRSAVDIGTVRSDEVAMQMGPLVVRFDLPPGRVVEESGNNYVLLGSRLRGSRGGGMTGRVLIAFVEDLFDGQAPDSFMSDNQVFGTQQTLEGQPDAISAWTMTVTDPACDPRNSCKSFANVVGDGQVLALESGTVNELDVISLAGTSAQIVVFTVNDNGLVRSTALLPSLTVR